MKDLLSYLKDRKKVQTYWLAVGSNQQVSNTDNGAWVAKFQEAYDTIKDKDTASDDLWQTLRDLLGKDFPVESETNASFSRIYTSAASGEQFIDELFPVDIRYNLSIECQVTQDGWRPALLRELLRRGQWLSHHKKLDFFIKDTNCPYPYSIYWKVRNVGSEAIRRNMIRGEIKKTDSSHQIEHTNFYGSHFVECYLVKGGICVARDRIDVPINWS